VRVSILTSDYPPGRLVFDRDGIAVRLRPDGRILRVWMSLHWRIATWPRRVRHACVCCGRKDTRTEGSAWCGLCKHGYCPRREQTGKECRR
jgi:hypothetical protein